MVVKPLYPAVASNCFLTRALIVIRRFNRLVIVKKLVLVLRGTEKGFPQVSTGYFLCSGVHVNVYIYARRQKTTKAK